MTDKPLPKDEPGAQQRFDQAIKNTLATRHKPHKPKDGSGAPDAREADPNNPDSGGARDPR